MKTPDSQPSVTEPVAAERAYRSPAGIAGGVLLLVMGAWLGFDALVNGDARTAWLAVAVLILVVPLVVAFTIRPAVYANEDRLRVRNPFRVITLPWASVADLRASYSSEVFTEGGDKYQLWAIPVSMRARKKANRRTGGRKDKSLNGAADFVPRKAAGDQSLDEIRELARDRADKPSAQGEPSIRWAYEIIAPAVVGAVLMAVLLLIG
ncbi:PH domain-containing protein [Streptomyces sp. NPDC056121]|uniref:PH domain-containing protein n=1 Tax=Streptomyces TaxID=1883 RepID=UPI001D0AC9AC|nr:MULTISPECIES: PH domain-containing protein [Streptomyces]MCX5083686.1 PH domain-containing protein [Streptomyces sp. NBC_00401]UDM01748.1 PH domain-containing protein [Streptomyces longhuiensis]